MRDLKILNKKEIKKILQLVKDQWDFTGELDYAFLLSNKERVYIVNRDIARLDLEKIRINSAGIYIGELTNGKFRLGIEGSQLIGPHAKKNVVELDSKEAREWLKGSDIEKQTDITGFAIIKHNNDYLGCGAVKQDRILNYVPKTRRLNVSD